MIEPGFMFTERFGKEIDLTLQINGKTKALRGRGVQIRVTGGTVLLVAIPDSLVRSEAIPS